MAAVVGVLAVPAVHPGQPDGFPLSTYPMFASARGREVAVATAVGLDESGRVRRLDPDTIGGTGEVMLAATTVRRAVGDGEDATARLCREIADRIDEGDEIVAVELRTETHDAVSWFAGQREPIDVRSHERCDVAT